MKIKTGYENALELSIRCEDCKTGVNDEDFYTEINPPGGYGRAQVLICDACMKSGRWDHWIKEHWPTWPHKTQRG